MLPLWKDANGGVQVLRLTEPDEVETLVRLFEEVAVLEDWKPGGALRLWVPHSVYFALTVERELAGGLQLVLPDELHAPPYQAVWPECALRPADRHAHVAVLALAHRFRGRSILFWRLVVELWRYCVGEGIASLSLEVTPRVLPLYRRLGWPLTIHGELRPHWGEDCHLCTLGIPEVAQALLQRAENSLNYRQVVAQAFRVTLAPREFQRAGEAARTGIVS